MSNYINLHFDTTPPKVSINAPSYTIPTQENIITVKADETLSSVQDIYVIDSKGNRRDYTFNKEDSNTLVGRIVFNDVSIGLVTLHIRVEDEVGNRSNLVKKTINILPSYPALSIIIADSERRLLTNDREQRFIAAGSRSVKFKYRH